MLVLIAIITAKTAINLKTAENPTNPPLMSVPIWETAIFSAATVVLFALPLPYGYNQELRLSCSMACGIFPDQGLTVCPLPWQVDSYPLYHCESPLGWY